MESLKALAPWFFALDHHNYARWIPIHIRAIRNLKNVVTVWSRKLLFYPIDQAHEQNNALVKGSGGAVGLTENPSAFRKWMTAGQEQARIMKEFEREFIPEVVNRQKHHDEGFCSQRVFKEQANNLVQSINEMGQSIP